MPFIHIIHIIILLLGIIYSCVFFTNAVEHLGLRLKLGNNAVGSILAVVGTTLPETVIPLVAISGSLLFHKNFNIASNIAQGAIIGSPFILSTFAIFLMALTLFISYLKKKRNKLELDVNIDNILRNYKYFLLTYTIGIITLFIKITLIKYFIALFLVVLYLIYVYRTIIKSKQNFTEEEVDELFILKPFKNKCPAGMFFVYLQIIISLFALVLFSHYFVREISIISSAFKFSAVLLSLFVTPYATELPECINSIIWVKNNKDDLAIANVVGAVVFQSMIPFTIGILLTNWEYSRDIFINSLFVISCSLLFIFSIIKYKKVKFAPMALCLLFYLGYFVYILVK